MEIKVDNKLCTGCETCISSCPYDAIVMKDDKAFINEYCQICKACLSVCPEGAIKEIERDYGQQISDLRLEDYKGILIFTEQREGKVSHIAYELLGVGRRLADRLGVDLNAALFGADGDEAGELIKWGADNVYLCSDDSLRNFNDEPYTDLLSEIVNRTKPEIVLAGATSIGRSFLPRVAVRIRAGLTADCTSLEIEENSRNFLQIRPAFGGNIMATIICPERRPQMATVRPRVMKVGEYNPDRQGEIIKIDPPSNQTKTRVLETIKEDSSCSVSIQEAEVIISGGRGLGNEKGFEMLKELAGLLNGVVGASRAAVDEGWIQYSHQVGQTGKTVCPKIYLACAISGAVQHLVGMQSSDIIIAINKNPEAPIFSIANYGVVGNINEVIPLLIKRLKELRK